MSWRLPVVGIVLVVGLLWPAVVPAETLSDRFRAGVEAFDAGRYDEAARIFRDLRERFHVTSSGLLVNLGAAEFMAGRPGAALLRFHEAIRTDPSSRAADTARVNAERVRAALNERRGDRGTGYVFGPYHDAWTALFGWMPAREVLFVFLAFWTLLFLSLAARRVLRGRIRGILTGVGVAAFAGSVLTGISAYGSDRVVSYEVGVVLVDATPLYERVDTLEPRMSLPEALEARVLERRGGLVRVRLSSGQEGFVPERSLGVPALTTP